MVGKADWTAAEYHHFLATGRAPQREAPELQETQRQQERGGAPGLRPQTRADLQPLCGQLAFVAIILQPLRTTTESNAKEHWRTKHARAKGQRWAAYYWLTRLAQDAACFPLPLRVTLTRVAPQPLDDDNLQSALKHVRDGVADYLDKAPGKGEDRKEGLSWVYRQERDRPKIYAVRIFLERLSCRPHS